jgi:hypothetical protein
VAATRREPPPATVNRKLESGRKHGSP